jgi:hypothetical protein
MEVIITEWGLQSYISLKGQGVFSDVDYKSKLRPDAELLKTDDPFDPNHPKFSKPWPYFKIWLQNEVAQLRPRQSAIKALCRDSGNRIRGRHGAKGFFMYVFY